LRLVYINKSQEFGDDCSEPNRRTAYLSYLDSVKYLEPAQLRTEVYHEVRPSSLTSPRVIATPSTPISPSTPLHLFQVLVAYLGDLKARGFNQMTLWSCPREAWQGLLPPRLC
jgi:hypothetical protein